MFVHAGGEVLGYVEHKVARASASWLSRRRQILASGELRPASANRPHSLRWPATQALLST